MLTNLMLAMLVAAEAPVEAEKPEAQELKILARAFWRAPARPGAAQQQLVIRSADEMAKLGGEDVLKTQFKVDKIDWETQMVVIATGGPKPTGGYSVEITGLTVAGKTLTVKWKLTSPEPGTIVSQAFTHPGQAVLVERFEGDVKFDPAAAKDPK